MRRKGRPPKYRKIIANLQAEQLYSPASIARFAQEKQLLSTESERQLARRRLRLCLGRMTHNKREEFPEQGDGIVRLLGQPPLPGWFGWRWRRAYNLGQEPVS